MQTILFALVAILGLQAPGQIAFRIADPELIPEGIAYDPQTRTGVFGFVGLRVDPGRRTLWAISSNAGDTMPARGVDKSCLGCSTIGRYDIDSGRLLKQYHLANTDAPHFLNDIAIAPSGDAYITDTRRAASIALHARGMSSNAGGSSVRRSTRTASTSHRTAGRSLSPRPRGFAGLMRPRPTSRSCLARRLPLSTDSIPSVTA